MRVFILGVGMGGLGSYTGAAASKLLQADLLIGAKRMVESAEPIFAHAGRDVPLHVEQISPSGVAKAITENRAMENVAVLCSGDTGFFSLASTIKGTLEGLDFVTDIDTEPGITTVQYLASRLGRPWQSCKLASAHGRGCNTLGLVLANEELFLLTGGDQTPKTIVDLLTECGLGFVEVTVGQRLSYDDEKIVTASALELAGQDFDDLAALWISHPPLPREEVRGHAGFPGIPDEFFVRGKAPMTKMEVRGLVSSKLCPKDGEVVWDVGAGTGSVSIEAACLNPFSKVYAIEFKDEACDLIEENRRRFGAYNVFVVRGKAPDALQGLPAPDAMFVGGSTGSLEEVLEAALSSNPRVRVIATAVTLETVSQAVEVFERLEGQGRIEGFASTQMGVTRTRRAGRYHLFAPESPVFIFEAHGTGQADGSDLDHES